MPLLRGPFSGHQESIKYGSRLVEVCRRALDVVLPFPDLEMEFLNIPPDKGVIDPSLFTSDGELQERIKQHPILEWEALHVRQYKREKIYAGMEEKE
jgi:hypothetical protein